MSDQSSGTKPTPALNTLPKLRDALRTEVIRIAGLEEADNKPRPDDLDSIGSQLEEIESAMTTLKVSVDSSERAQIEFFQANVAEARDRWTALGGKQKPASDKKSASDDKKSALNSREGD